LLIGFIGDFSWPAHQEISQSQYFCPLHCRLILPKEEAAEVAPAGRAVLELLAVRGGWQEEQWAYLERWAQALQGLLQVALAEVQLFR
jgi:hypothetical protein